MALKNVSRGQLKAKLTEALIRASLDVGKEPDRRGDFERRFCFAGLLRYATPNQRYRPEVSLYLTPLPFEEGR